MYSIGKNIKNFRKSKGISQENLAEKFKLGANYIGMIERNEKILNGVEISADVILANQLKVDYEVKNSVFNEKFSKISKENQDRIYADIDVSLQCGNKA